MLEEKIRDKVLTSKVSSHISTMRVIFLQASTGNFKLNVEQLNLVKKECLLVPR